MIAPTSATKSRRPMPQPVCPARAGKPPGAPASNEQASEAAPYKRPRSLLGSTGSHLDADGECSLLCWARAGSAVDGKTGAVSATRTFTELADGTGKAVVALASAGALAGATTNLATAAARAVERGWTDPAGLLSASDVAGSQAAPNTTGPQAPGTTCVPATSACGSRSSKPSAQPTK